MIRAAMLALLFFPAPPASGLGLEVRLKSATAPFCGDVEFTVRFVNRGERLLSYYEPSFADADCFPEIRFVRVDDGRVFVPWTAPYQTMVSEGLVGAVITMTAGAEKTHTYAPGRFLPAGATDWGQPVRLPPGEYRILAAYEKKDSLVPWNIGGFDEELRPWKGAVPLFTGRVESEPVTLTVGRAVAPWISLAQSDRDRPEVLVTFTNPTPTETRFEGEAVLEVRSKMYGGGEARAVLPMPLTVPSGGRREERIDLRRLTFAGRAGSCGLNEMIDSGTAWFRLSLRHPDGTEATAADGIFGNVPPAANAGLEELAVSVSTAGTEVTVTVQNRGTAPRRVARRLAFPHEVLLRIEDASGARKTVRSVGRTAPDTILGLLPAGGEDALECPEGQAYDGDRFDKVRGLAESDFVPLGPGESVARTLDLAEVVHGGLPAGRYAVRAAYRCVEPGWRLGFAEAAPTGVLWSLPVTVAIGGK